MLLLLPGWIRRLLRSRTSLSPSCESRVAGQNILLITYVAHLGILLCQPTERCPHYRRAQAKGGL